MLLDREGRAIENVFRQLMMEESRNCYLVEVDVVVVVVAAAAAEIVAASACFWNVVKIYAFAFSLPKNMYSNRKDMHDFVLMSLLIPHSLLKTFVLLLLLLVP